MPDRHNDSHLRSRHNLIGDFDITIAASQVGDIYEIPWPPGNARVIFAYEIIGTGGTNVSFKIEGRPAGATNWFEMENYNTQAHGQTVYAAASEAWIKPEQIRVTHDATAGTYTGTSTLKVWIVS